VTWFSPFGSTLNHNEGLVVNTTTVLRQPESRRGFRYHSELTNLPFRAFTKCHKR
jgi:hypothetical protein